MKPFNESKIPFVSGLAAAILLGLTMITIRPGEAVAEGRKASTKSVKARDDRTAKRKRVTRRPANVILSQEGAINRSQFIAAARSELDKSLAKTRQTLVTKKAEINNLMADAYDPWSASLTAKHKQYSLITGYAEGSSVLALTYSNPQGLSIQAFGDYFEPTDWGVISARTSVFNYGATLSQEVISGWGRSAYHKNRQAVAAEGLAQEAAAEAAFLSQVLSIVDTSNKLFSAQCKLRDMKQLMMLTEKSLEISRIQRAARTISSRDQLRIAEAHLNIERQVMATTYEIETLINSFAGISEAAEKSVRGIEFERFDCENEVESLSHVKPVPRAEMVEISRRHPSLLNLELQRQAVAEKTETFQIKRRPSLQVQAGYTRVEDRAPSRPYDDYYVGLSFTYQFQNDQYDSQIKSMNLESRSLLVQEKQAALDLASFIGRLYAQLDYLMRQVPVAQKSLGNTRQILKIIQTQQEIGEMDASAVESAYSGYLNSIISARELWAETVSLTQKLEEIKASVQRLENP